MDISQFEVRIPSLRELNTHINETIKKEVRKQLELVLLKISQGENLSLDDLKDRYLRMSDIDSSVISKQPKKQISPEEQCHANVSTGSQCSRRCKPPSSYCGGHMNSRPYGSVD